MARKRGGFVAQRQGGPLVRGVAIKGKANKWQAYRSEAARKLKR